MRSTVRRNTSLALNISIIVMEIVALAMSITTTGRVGIEWYTVESNLLALFSSCFLVVFLVLKKPLPGLLKWLKYTAVLGLLVTFLVTILVLAPMYQFNYGYLLFYNNLVFHHLLCPIVAVLSFVFFDDIGKLSIKDTRLSMIWTIGYAIVMVALNIVGVVDGPYPFLMVTKQPLFATILWLITIPGAAYFLSFLLRKFYSLSRNKS